MFDSAQRPQADRNAATNVRYASACRQRSLRSTTSKSLNECPIRFSLSSPFPTLNNIEIDQRMSDMFQLVVTVPYAQQHQNQSTLTVRNECSRVLTELNAGKVDDKLKRIGHSLHSFCQVEC